MITKLCSKQVRIFLLALTLLILFGCQSAPEQTLQEAAALQQPAKQAETLPTKTYINTKYGFTFSYPRIFERRKNYQEGDGMYFMTDDVSLLIWGAPADSYSTNQSLAQGVSNKGLNITYDGYTIRTYDKNELRYCYGSKHKDDVMIQIQFTYPIEQEDQYRNVVELLIEEISSNK